MDAVADLDGSDRAIRGAGTGESVWLPWLASFAAPRLLLPSRPFRLVVVAPHPDDEVLACGGWIADHARRGGAVTVLAVTDGEASHAADPLRQPRLAATRRLESERGLARLGVRLDTSRAGLVRLGLPDGEVARHASAIGRALHLLLQPGDAVVTTWRFDGHPDHEATGAAASRACEVAGIRCLEAPVWMWHWSAPADARIPWDRLRSVPLSPWAREAKANALRAHASQMAPRATESPVLGEAIVQRADRDVEYYFA